MTIYFKFQENAQIFIRQAWFIQPSGKILLWSEILIISSQLHKFTIFNYKLKFSSNFDDLKERNWSFE